MDPIQQLFAEADEAVFEVLETSQSGNALARLADLLQVAKVYIEQVPEQDRHFLLQKLELYNEKPLQLRKRIRSAQLVAQKEKEEEVHKARLREFGESSPREQLFSGRKEAPQDDLILTQNKNITLTLQTTKQLMTMSVMQTELNIDTLDQQTRDLSSLNDKLVDMSTVLDRLRQIVRFIEKQDKSDRRRIYTAMGFLALCSLRIVWRRILKMPVRILVWTLLRTFGVVSWLTSMGVGKGHAGVTQVGVSHTGVIETASHIESLVLEVKSRTTLALASVVTLSLGLSTFDEVVETMNWRSAETETASTSKEVPEKPVMDPVEVKPEPLIMEMVESVLTETLEIATEPHKETVDATQLLDSSSPTHVSSLESQTDMAFNLPEAYMQPPVYDEL